MIKKFNKNIGTNAGAPINTITIVLFRNGKVYYVSTFNFNGSTSLVLDMAFDPQLTDSPVEPGS